METEAEIFNKTWHEIALKHEIHINALVEDNKLLSARIELLEMRLERMAKKLELV